MMSVNNHVFLIESGCVRLASMSVLRPTSLWRVTKATTIIYCSASKCSLVLNIVQN